MRCSNRASKTECNQCKRLLGFSFDTKTKSSSKSLKKKILGCYFSRVYLFDFKVVSAHAHLNIFTRLTSHPESKSGKHHRNAA
jgi:hypothetical protein